VTGPSNVRVVRVIGLHTRPHFQRRDQKTRANRASSKAPTPAGSAHQSQSELPASDSHIGREPTRHRGAAQIWS
jgi:hypothetical protein